MKPCSTCLSHTLMFLNYVQAFNGVSILIYSLWILTCWSTQQNEGASWFVWFAFGVGVSVCLIAFIGYVSAEVTNGCCLCFYALFTSILIVSEAALVCDIILNKQWEKDFPRDHTGELKRLSQFIEANIDMCKWFAIVVFAIQMLSIMLAMILRLMARSKRVNTGRHEDYDAIRKPLLNQLDAPIASTSSGNEKIPMKTWRSAMKDKLWWAKNQSSDEAVV
ncbi:tetraspanin-18-like [Dioscorea cayenensis subsp. rotundata]|uniref:Tetraspanin-18-like n=1 Tax=Dioscorea cayennensis subsp. rotundata TaxID=55577 RepID=A0AB40CDH6_DIOCR|nr:tetraspanin-18-like [Dioscorea cayenensis subsp. rotundata]